MKKIYVVPEMTVTEFSLSDIITASGDTPAVQKVEAAVTWNTESGAGGVTEFEF